jgi:hypothetical protein
MNPQQTGAMLIERQMRALLDLIETDRARQCAQIVGAANGRAAAQRVQARADARACVRQAFEEQRLRRRERLAAAQAQLATQRRLHAQQRTAALLRLAWERLPGELLALWQQPVGRAAWVAHVLEFARVRLPAGTWRIVHAPDWLAIEWQAHAAERGGIPQLHADPAIRAGLKVVANGNVIDGTLAGLLSERAEIDARLLRLLEGS